MTVDIIAVWLPVLAMWGLVSLIGRTVRWRRHRTAQASMADVADSASSSPDPGGRDEFEVLWTAQDDKDLYRLLKKAAP